MADVITVVFYWWTDRQGKSVCNAHNRYYYTADDVRMGVAMVRRNLTVPHEFVVITDRLEAFAGDSDIRAVPLNQKTFVPGTRFAKLMTYAPQTAELVGRRLMVLDLDFVCCGNLDHVARRTEDLVLWRNPNHKPGTRRARYNTSIVLHTPGTRPALFAGFDPVKDPARLRQKTGGTDQAWISEQVDYDHPAYLTPQDDGVYGAGRMKDADPSTCRKLPENACLVFFPGNRTPKQDHIQAEFTWIKEHRR
jgi:hypothetical protein